MVIGSGPIVIGQACEFDYSGTQACTVLRPRASRCRSVNSNPATIMTDPEFADRTYIEPLTPASVLQILERERPDALLPTLGGQTGLNVSVALAESGDLDRLGVRMIGASLEAIHKAEDRSGFQRAMLEAGLDVPRSGIARSVEEAVSLGTALGFPVIVRPSFTLGGGGSGFADDRAGARGRRGSVARGEPRQRGPDRGVDRRLEGVRARGDARRRRQRRDRLLDRERRSDGRAHRRLDHGGARSRPSATASTSAMRDAAIEVLRVIGVETGGSNVQFAVDPSTGRQVLIEMNPRVSRSSALASKATGFPIAKIAALARRRVPARRDHERHHRRDAGCVRTDAGLRRREDPSLRVREVPRRRYRARARR